VRWILALALAVHFTGLPAVGGVVCSTAAAGKHSCCQREAPAGSFDLLSGHCGCAMTPDAPVEHHVPVAVQPDSRDAGSIAVPAAAPAVLLASLSSEPIANSTSTLVPVPSGFLTGAGFRC